MGRLGRGVVAVVLGVLVSWWVGVAAFAAGTATDGLGYGVSANVTLVGQANAMLGPLPLAQQTLSTSVPSTDTASLASAGLSGVLSTGVLTASTAGDPLADTSGSSAQVSGVDLVAGLVAADAIGSTCEATATGVTGSATLAGASAGLAGLGRTALASSPAPNTVVQVRTALNVVVARIVLNEQRSVVSGGVRQITVDALHLTLIGGVTGSLGTGDVVVGRSFCQAQVVGTPSVTAVSPVLGPTAGGTTVSVTGTDLVGVTGVSVGGVSVPFDITSPTTLRLTTPALPSGQADIRVTGPAGSSANTSADDFTAVPGPTLTSLSPGSGPEAGGTTVTISGTGLTGAAGVFFGAVPASGLQVVGDGSLTAVSPAGTGSVAVTVRTAGGTSPVVAAGTFAYLPPAPTVIGLAPSSGPETGGTMVTVTGTGFTADTTVTIGVVTQPVTFVDETTVRFTTPAHAHGPASVTLTTPSGSVDTTFTYVAIPTVSGLSPAAGTDAGGTSVTITGTGLGAVSAVDFGAAGATIQSRSATSLTVTTPVHAAGPVTVTLTGPGAVSTDAGSFVFTAPALPGAPVVTTVAPGTGPEAGGSGVIITGTGFTGTTAVDFGGTPASSFTVVSDTLITAVSPAGTGTAAVRVTGPGGTSPVSAAVFAYLPPAPTIASLSPTSGPEIGGTQVTVTGTRFTPDTVATLAGQQVAGVVVNETTLRFTTPADTAGPVSVRVSNGQGTSAATTFTYLAVPQPAGLSTATAAVVGGTSVTVTGTGLGQVSAVDVGGDPGSITAQTSTSLAFTAPAHLAGPATVTLTGPGVVQTLAGVLTYLPPAPHITSTSPGSGPVGGGTHLTITGTGLTGLTGVTIGGTAATFTVVDDTTVTVTAPASAVAGTVPVVLTGPGGVADTTFRYLAAPTLLDVSPNAGPLSAGASVTLTGTGFTGATAVDFGAVPAIGFTVVDDVTITATVPAHTAGTVRVTVTTPGGTIGSDAYTFRPAPAITGLGATAGPAAGGTTITITGTDLTGTDAVTIGDAPAASFTVTGPTTITAVSAAHPAGAVDVTVHTVGGDSNAAAFTFLSAPRVTGLSPELGSTTGGTLVTITGTALAPASSVTFGGVPATVVSATATQVQVHTPPHPAGPVTVTLTTPGGVATAGTFTFQQPPAVTAVVPGSGTPGGGTLVTITGTGFTGTSTVDFGGTPAGGFTVLSDTTITATAPAHLTGVVDVRVVTPAGTSPVTDVDAYTYLGTPVPDAPVITSVSPDHGVPAGGTTVTITGSGFAGTSTVDFGGTPAGGFTVLNDTTITAIAPAHAAGTVEVTVTTPAGASTPDAASHFTYQNTPAPVPAILNVVPAFGPPAGGTPVTITGQHFADQTTVLFGDQAGTSVTVNLSGTALTVVVPAHIQGLVDLTLSTAAGSVTLPDGYRYIAPPIAPTQPQFQSVGADTTIAVAIDPNLGAGLHLVSCGLPHHGTTVLDATTNACVYTPDRGYSGDDQFSYTAANVVGEQVTQTVLLLIQPRPALAAQVTGTLPETGTNLPAILAIGLLCLATGAALIGSSRGQRRSLTSHTG